jgi:hypothetical protein
VEIKRGSIPRVNPQKTTIVILAALAASIVLADDFKTINGKEYKNVTVSRVEPDGIVLKSKSGISKVYFTELPAEIQKKYGYDPQAAAAQSAPQDANGTACLDVATARSALNSGGASLAAGARAEKSGDSATAALHTREYAASLRVAASALGADAAVSQPLMRAAESYDKAAAANDRGDWTEAGVCVTAAVGLIKTSRDAMRHSSVPRCR